MTGPTRPTHRKFRLRQDLPTQDTRTVVIRPYALAGSSPLVEETCPCLGECLRRYRSASSRDRQQRSPGLDAPGQGRPTGTGPGQARLHGASDQCQVIRRPDRGAHRRGQAVPRSRRGPGVAADPRLRPRRAPRRPTCRRRTADGRDGARRRRHRRDLPFRSRQRLQRRAVRDGVSASRGPPVDGPGPVVLDAATRHRSFHSTLEFELLRKHHFATGAEARTAVAAYTTATTAPGDTAAARGSHRSCSKRSSPPGRPKPSPTGRPHENRPPGSPGSPTTILGGTRHRADDRLQSTISPPRLGGRPSSCWGDVRGD